MKKTVNIFWVCAALTAIARLMILLSKQGVDWNEVGMAIKDSAIEQIQIFVPFGSQEDMEQEDDEFVITPQGTVNIAYTSSEGSGEDVIIPTEVTVKTAKSVEDGYSDTIAEFVYAGTVCWNVVVFDRYTGKGLFVVLMGSEPCGDFDMSQDMQMRDSDGAMLDFTALFDQTVSDEGVVTVTVTVHHPASYDGLVFQYGGSGTGYYAENYLSPQNSETEDDDSAAQKKRYLFTATNQ
ncbi:MAG: hypothetical protein ACI4DO_03550 [Roseburia sp.]